MPTPRKDLLSAGLLAASALAVMGLSTRLEVPDRWYTAPGLLPFVTGAALLAMALALGWQALAAGAARRPLGHLAASLRALTADGENRRAALLALLVLAYVLLVARIDFELRVQTAWLELVVSGYELVSIVMIATVLRLFWRARVLRCLIVAAVGVETLAWAFRYGFHMIMPEAF